MIKILKTIGILYATIILFSCREIDNTETKATPSISILDMNNDGIIDPYETLDALFVLQKENKKSEFSLEEFESIAKNSKKQESEEFLEEFKELDKNNNGKIEFAEVDEEMSGFVGMMDENKNGEVTKEEMLNFDFGKAFFSSEEEINEHIEEIFYDYKAKDTIHLLKIESEKREHYSTWDRNRDGKITKKEVKIFERANNTPASFKVKGTIAYMNGVITSEFPATILRLLFEHPEVTTIEMITCPGSVDDVSNLRASMYVHRSGLTIKLNSHSYIASGGTDFFLAGKRRIIEEGAILGVHSWGGAGVEATDFPKDDPEHQKYLDYYKKINIPEDFYWYTLEAAPAGAIHTMTESEIVKYKVRTN